MEIYTFSMRHKEIIDDTVLKIGDSIYGGTKMNFSVLHWSSDYFIELVVGLTRIGEDRLREDGVGRDGFVIQEVLLVRRVAVIGKGPEEIVYLCVTADSIDDNISYFTVWRCCKVIFSIIFRL